MSSAQRTPIVGVMGSGSEAHSLVAQQVGRLLAQLGVHLLTGGGGGVMAAVSQAFTDVEGRAGLAIGVLPCVEGDPLRPKPGYPNPWIEIPISTHLPRSGARGTEPMSRNHINVLSCDAIIVLPGGAGTASEIELAIRYGRPLIAYLGEHEGQPDWPVELRVARTIAEVEAFLRETLRR